MDGVFHGLIFVIVYIDNILVASTSVEEHKGHIEQVLVQLEENCLMVNKNKCLFGVKELDYLGHHISAKKITPLKERILYIQEITTPFTKTSLQRFLAMINFDHRFMPMLSDKLRPLHKTTTSKGNNITLTTEYQPSFDQAKSALAASKLLHHHPETKANIITDASDKIMGGKLIQGAQPD